MAIAERRPSQQLPFPSVIGQLAGCQEDEVWQRSTPLGHGQEGLRRDGQARMQCVRCGRVTDGPTTICCGLTVGPRLANTRAPSERELWVPPDRLGLQGFASHRDSLGAQQVRTPTPVLFDWAVDERAPSRPIEAHRTDTVLTQAPAAPSSGVVELAPPPPDFRAVDVPARSLYLLPGLLGLPGAFVGWTLVGSSDRRMSMRLWWLGATTTLIALCLLALAL